MNHEAQLSASNAAGIIRSMLGVAPIDAAIILGSGLGDNIRDMFDGGNCSEMSYQDLKGFFPQPKARTHAGELYYGAIGGQRVLVFSGRFHMYEGHDASTVTIPVLTARELGAATLITTCAAGNLNPRWNVGDVMVATDHISLQRENCLRGDPEDGVEPTILDQFRPYDHTLQTDFIKHALDRALFPQCGVYVATDGPALSTRAEYRWLYTLGADAVTMGTLPEVQAALALGMKVLSLAVLTDNCDRARLKRTSIVEIVEVANQVGPMLRLAIADTIRGI